MNTCISNVAVHTDGISRFIYYSEIDKEMKFNIQSLLNYPIQTRVYALIYILYNLN